MLITLFTDASFSQTHHRATYAAWAKSDGLTHRHSGSIKRPVQNSTEAELYAIANGLAFTKLCFSPPAQSRIIVQTDCQVAISILQKGKTRSPASQEAVNYILTYFKTNAYISDFRHVYGHKGTETKRNAVNTWCDTECRRQMGRLLLQLQGQGQLQENLNAHL